MLLVCLRSGLCDLSILPFFEKSVLITSTRALYNSAPIITEFKQFIGHMQPSHNLYSELDQLMGLVLSLW